MIKKELKDEQRLSKGLWSYTFNGIKQLCHYKKVEFVGLNKDNQWKYLNKSEWL